MKKVVLVSGPCAVGKTTLRYILRKEVGHTVGDKIAGIDVDDTFSFIDPTFSGKDYLETWSKARILAGSIAKQLFSQGTKVVYIFGNTIFSMEQVKEVLMELQKEDDIEIHHITLKPNEEEIKKRFISRDGHVPFWLAGHLNEREPHLTEEWTTIIDNSYMTPEATIQEIHKRVQQRRGVGRILRKISRRV